MYITPTTLQITRGALITLVLSLLVTGLLMFLTGCRTGQKCDIVNYGELHYTQTVDRSPVTNSKEVPFDVLRGFAQGSAVSAAPGATSTQSGSGTFDNGTATPAASSAGIKPPPTGATATKGGDGTAAPGVTTPGG